MVQSNSSKILIPGALAKVMGIGRGACLTRTPIGGTENTRFSALYFGTVGNSKVNTDGFQDYLLRR